MIPISAFSCRQLAPTLPCAKENRCPLFFFHDMMPSLARLSGRASRSGQVAHFTTELPCRARPARISSLPMPPERRVSPSILLYHLFRRRHLHQPRLYSLSMSSQRMSISRILVPGMRCDLPPDISRCEIDGICAFASPFAAVTV